MSKPRGLRLVALLGALVIFAGALSMSVRESQLPPTTRGDVMRMIYTADMPEQIEPLVILVERAPGQLDLATPRPPSEPRSALVLEGPPKAVTPGRRGNRGRGRRRSRPRPT